VIRSVESGEERELPLEMPMVTGNYWTQTQIRGALRWSPDGRSILCGGHPTMVMDLHLIDVRTGNINSIVLPSLRDGFWASVTSYAWSPDGKMIFYTIVRMEMEGGEFRRSIIAHDLETGQDRELCPVGSHGEHMAVSPDGRQLAFADEDGRALKVMPTAGGEARRLLSPRNEDDESYEHVAPVAWTPDGRYLLFLKDKHSSDGSPIGLKELWRISAEGGEPQKLLELKSWQWWASLHPDGERIAFAKGGHARSEELWVMENLLTTLAADK